MRLTVIRVMLTGLVLVFGLSACDLMSHSHCDNNTVNEVKSPDGKYIAVLYHRSCVNGASYTWVVCKRIRSYSPRVNPFWNWKGFMKSTEFGRIQTISKSVPPNFRIRRRCFHRRLTGDL